jgi:hypothetical protein
MNRTMRLVGVGLVLFLCLGVPEGQAQQPIASEPQTANRTVQTPTELVPALPVPRLVKFAGMLKDELGKPRTGVVGVTFSVYKEQGGGAALWVETQNVELDEQGHYTALLGTTQNEGLPLQLFASGEPRWLAVRVNLSGEVEQPRVLLVSVPYALKAADADTLGGMPASAFVLAAPNGTVSGLTALGAATQASANSKTAAKAKGTAKNAVTAATIAANFIPVFTDNTGTLGSSAMFQSGGFIGVGTTTPAAALHVNGDTLLVTSATTAQLQFSGTASEARFGQDGNGAFFASDTPGKAVRFYTNNGTLNEGLRIDSSSNVGIGTPSPVAKLDVVGTGNFTGNTTAFSSAIVSATQSGSSPTPFIPSPSTVPPVAVGGIATATSGVTAGVGGISFSPNSSGVGGLNFSSVAGSGVYGFSAATSGHGIGIQGEVASADGVAAYFANDAGGNILLGQTGPNGTRVNVFRVDGTGKGFFDGGTQTGGADFAEAISVRGERLEYEPGDVLVVDPAAGRRLMLSRRAYSTRVAGIYSTKPGVLATIHPIDESDALIQEVPVAIVGIVPCKVTAENGPIAPGDLLVTSSTPRYAMKGTNRNRMLGAVVGKALEPLREGKGVIQILVTLQ